MDKFTINELKGFILKKKYQMSPCDIGVGCFNEEFRAQIWDELPLQRPAAQFALFSQKRVSDLVLH